MNKLIAGMALIFVAGYSFAEPPSAGWNFGTDTYGQHDSQLILNSLSDRYGISTFQTPTQSLGTNDYIEENGVKNTLALDGYTKAYDYNPNSTTGYGYSSVYNQPLPNVPLTKLTFMGLDGDPTKAQDVYVLTSEYNALSSQGQAASINALNNGLVQVQGQTTINTQNISGLSAGLSQTSMQTVANTQNIGVLATGLAQTNIQTAINTQNIGALDLGLNNETTARIAGDNVLQNQINATNNNVSALDNRVSNIERLKVMPEADIRFFDSRHVSAIAYDAYDATNGRNFAVGVKVMLKLGKSWEDTRIDKLEKEIATLLAQRGK